MPRSRNPARYRDVQKLCDIALAKGECIYAPPTRGNAMHIRQRFYTFLKIMEDLDPSSPYCTLGSKLEDNVLIIADFGGALDEFIQTDYDEGDLREAPVTERAPLPEPVDDLSPAERAKRLLEGDE